ncbi:MAG: hypothetical protein Q7I94_03510 [Candidatus Contubernalis sp.]|nr:hypothetical protein [Candidatus Contubernalis sp.]
MLLIYIIIAYKSVRQEDSSTVSPSDFRSKGSDPRLNLIVVFNIPGGSDPARLWKFPSTP